MEELVSYYTNLSEYKSVDYEQIAKLIMTVLNKYGGDENYDSDLTTQLASEIRAEMDKSGKFSVWMSLRFFENILRTGNKLTEQQRINREKLLEA